MPEKWMSCEISVVSVPRLGLVEGQADSPSARCLTLLLGVLGAVARRRRRVFSLGLRKMLELMKRCKREKKGMLGGRVGQALLPLAWQQM